MRETQVSFRFTSARMEQRSSTMPRRMAARIVVALGPPSTTRGQRNFSGVTVDSEGDGTLG
jgi:hypothetical protein